MADKDRYTQCELVRPEGEATRTQVVWIPSVLARIGRRLAIRLADGMWEDGWSVTARYASQELSAIDLQRKVHRRFDEVLGGE